MIIPRFASQPGCACSGRLPAHQEANRPSATVVMPYQTQRRPGRSITDPLRSIPQVAEPFWVCQLNTSTALTARQCGIIQAQDCDISCE